MPAAQTGWLQRFGPLLLLVLLPLASVEAQDNSYILTAPSFTPSKYQNSAGYMWSGTTSTDASGNYYMYSNTASLVVKVNALNNITELANDTVLYQPIAIAADSSGNAYVLDLNGASGSRRLCSIPAGTTGSCLTVAGMGVNQQYSTINALYVDASGNVYVGYDYTGTKGVWLVKNGMSTALSFLPTLSSVSTSPGAIAITWDASGNCYTAGTNTVVKYAPASAGSTSFVGSVLAGSGQARFVDGTGAAASFNFGSGGVISMVVDGSGNVLVSDYNNHRIRKITPAGVVTTIAGCGTTSASAGCVTATTSVTPLALATYLSTLQTVFLVSGFPALFQGGGSIYYTSIAPPPPPPKPSPPPFQPSGSNVGVCVTYRLFGYSTYTFGTEQGHTFTTKFSNTLLPASITNSIPYGSVSFANISNGNTLPRSVDVAFCLVSTFTYSPCGDANTPSAVCPSPSPSQLTILQAALVSIAGTNSTLVTLRTTEPAYNILGLSNLLNISMVVSPTISYAAPGTFNFPSLTLISSTLTIIGWSAAQFASVSSSFESAVASYIGQSSDSVAVLNATDASSRRRLLVVTTGVAVRFQASVSPSLASSVSLALQTMPNSTTFQSTLASAAVAANLAAPTSLFISQLTIASSGTTPAPPSSSNLPLSIDAPSGTSNPGSETSIGKIIAIAASLGITVGPGTAFTVAAIFYKKPLRRWLLKRKLRWLADLVVPDLEGDVALLEVKMAELEKFMSKQKLPRLQDCTPELESTDVELEVDKALGAGGYGAVYRGRIVSRDLTVAVKALFGTTGDGVDGKPVSVPDDVRKKMKREATIMCSLNHPHVLHVFGVVPDRGWIIMELCAGGSLATLLRDPEEALTSDEQLRFATEMATGIAYLHMSDVAIVHGDLKADNVLLTAAPERSVRICDFGMADAKDRSKSMTTVLGTGAGAGVTVQWTAPELLKGEAKTFASDVFAMGITLWEIFERDTPFGTMPEMVVINQLLAGQRPIVTDKTPPDLLDIVRACWAQDAQKRPKAAQVAYLLSAMKRYGDGETKTISRSILGGIEGGAAAA